MTGPGWYPDPSGNGARRYWDGQQWTQHQAPPAKTTSTGKTVAIVLGSIFALVVVGAIMSSNDDKKNDATPDRSPASDSIFEDTGSSGQPSVGLNQAVRDGKFEFVVNGISSQSGYVVVQMTVANIGNEPQTFFPQNQKLIDQFGREYECDTMAVYKFNDDGITALNPGLSTAILVPYQAPPNTQFSAVEVHDSAFSGGARVTLG